MSRIGIVAGAVAAAVLFAAPASAQATRTWVSGVGDDVNPCSRTAPCKTFAGAIAKTAAGGEISILDSAGYGAVTITKSIAIVAEGHQGSILGAQTNGIIVNAGPNDTVLLHGLFIEGAGNGIDGVRIIGGGQVHIRNSLIRGFRGQPGSEGIEVTPGATTKVVVSDTTIEANTSGIVVKTAATNATPGAAPPKASVLLNNVEVIQNSGAGVTADGPGSEVQINQSVIAQNGSGLVARSGGAIVSFRNNVVTGNTQDGAATATPALN